VTQTTAASSRLLSAALFATPQIELEVRPDGSRLLRSVEPLQAGPVTLLHAFRDGTRAHPERLLVAQRNTAGWQRLTWGRARLVVDRLAQGLLSRDLADRPVMLLSGNSIEHLLLTLAAWTVGAPVVPVSVAYSLQSTDHAKLAAMAALAAPGVVFAQDPSFGQAVDVVREGRQVVLAAGDVEGSLLLADLEEDPTLAVDARVQALRPDSIAKILFTSGSTGTPKGVVNPHGLLAANQQQMRQVWPFLGEEPPVLLDWLPWSHTFGGNHNVGLVLRNGGSLWVDDGKPVAGLIERTVRNLADVSPTVYFNVPAGYSALLPLLERDPEAAARFFARLRLGFFAAAALPQQLWNRVEKLAAEHGSNMRMTTSWGLTETGPAATTTHFSVTRSDCIGVPLPGVELKLVPTGTKTEVRLRGPNVTPGYHLRDDLTAAGFDEEGFLRTGDGVELVDKADPAQGLVFTGRIAEDFKLSTGTFVSVGTLRPALLSAAAGLLQDAVLTGHDGEYVGALVWLHADHAHRCDEHGAPDPELRRELRACLQRLAAKGGGSSQRVDRLLVLTEPAALDAGETTDKGYVNQRAVLERRAAQVQVLHREPYSELVVTRV